MYTEFAARRFAWGLSQGIAILGCAGGFWLALGLFGGIADAMGSPLVWISATAATIAGVVINLLGARALYRRAGGFSLADLRASATPQRSDAARQVRRFRIINGAQSITIMAIVIVTQSIDRGDLMWPLMGIVVGIHFVPLANVFRVPAYRLTGIVITLASVAALLVQPPLRLLILGVGTGAALWVTSAYLLLTANTLVQAEASRTA